MAGCNELASEQPVTEIYNVLSIWTLKNACQRHRFPLGVITSDLSSLAALALRSVSNEPAPGLRWMSVVRYCHQPGLCPGDMQM